jgi:hypothetical protein
MFGFLHVPTQIYCLTGAIRARHLNYINYDTILHRGPPSLRLHKGAGWVVGVAGFLGGRPREAAFCRGHRTGAGVGLRAVHGDDLLPLAHLDGESLGPLGDHHTANEGPVKIQYKCLVPIYVFPEMKLLFPKQNYNVLSPCSYTHRSVRDCCKEICGPILGIYKWLTDT